MTEFGHLLETFVYGEVASQASWIDGAPRLGHFRTNRGHEVDLVLERRDGGVIGIEVKASGQIRDDDLTGLRELRSLLGDQFVQGLALYFGPYSHQAEDRIAVLPVDRLWTG